MNIVADNPSSNEMDIEMRESSGKKSTGSNKIKEPIAKRSLLNQFFETEKEEPRLQNFINFSDDDDEPAKDDDKSPLGNIANIVSEASKNNRIMKTGPPPMYTTRQFSFSQVPGDQANTCFAQTKDIAKLEDEFEDVVNCKRNLFSNENADPNLDSNMKISPHKNDDRIAPLASFLDNDDFISKRSDKRKDRNIEFTPTKP